MRNKVCTKCKQEKALSEFRKHKTTKDKLRSECKTCKAKIDKVYRKKLQENNPWYSAYKHAKERCENKNREAYKWYGGRGIKILMTQDDFKRLWFRDKAYLLKQPSIDRIDNDGHYEYSNCQFIEKYKNSVKDKNKSILQFDLEGKFIREWESIKKAVVETGVNHVGMVARGHYSQAGGFIWRYKDKSRTKI